MNVPGPQPAGCHAAARDDLWSRPRFPLAAYLGLGANQGDRLGQLRRALFALLTHPELRVKRVSPVYETEHVGFEVQPPHLNACAAVETSLAPRVLLAVLKSTEQRLGRRPHSHLAPRPIDLDILVYGDRILHSDALTVPHPRLAEREFVLRPLADVAPRLVLPDRGETVTVACARITDRGGPWVRLHEGHPLLPDGPGGAEEDWRASLAVHCR
ncbi:MAG: 2-amino-4-hydroxy-6-hydroxymethyldihydropteridine diphosphokinase [Candidatus Krumholzibacteriia bacterium]